MSKTLQTRIQLKPDTEANWNTASNNSNFVPLAGEVIVYDADENNPAPRIKVGNGGDVVGNLPLAAVPETWVDEYGNSIQFTPTDITLVDGNGIKDAALYTKGFYLNDAEKGFIVVSSNPAEDGYTTIGQVNEGPGIAAVDNIVGDTATLIAIPHEDEETGELYGTVWSTEGVTITNLPTPINSTDAANKEYVDSITPAFTVVGTTLVVGNAATIPAAEDYSF